MTAYLAYVFHGGSSFRLTPIIHEFAGFVHVARSRQDRAEVLHDAAGDVGLVHRVDVHVVDAVGDEVDLLGDISATATASSEGNINNSII